MQGMTVPARRPWAAWEVEFLRRNYASFTTEALAAVLGRTVPRVLSKANGMGLKKSAELVAQIARQRTLAPGHGGRASQFKPGLVPWNKGSKGLVGVQPACRATQFKPGDRPHTWLPIGSYTVNSDGYLDRKVCDHGPRHVRWKPVHRLVWEAAHGPVPAGHLVVFRHGRKTTELALITLDAVECISRAEHAARNSIHNLPPELAELARLRGKLTRAINTKAKEAEQP